MSRASRRSSSSSFRGTGVPLVDRLASPGQAWRVPLDAMLLATVLFAAFNYGATEAWSQQLVAVFAVLVGGYALLACFVTQTGCRPVGSWTYVPIAAFLGLAVLQTVPLPAGVVRALAGGTFETRSTLLADLPATQSSMTLSLFPEATWRQLWPLLPVIVVFVVALLAYRTEDGVRRLCQLLVLAVVPVIGLALFQNLAGESSFTHSGGLRLHGHSGPFINHSHFGQFVNLGIGAAIGLGLVQVLALAKKYRSRHELMRVLGRDKASLGLWVCFGVAVLGALAVLLSLTRGGVIALLVAGGVAGLLLVRTAPRGPVGSLTAGRASGSDFAAVLMGLGFVMVAVALAFGFDRIYERLASIREFEVAQGGRFEIVGSLWPAFMKYPLWGTGLGTFEFVYPKYDLHLGRGTALTTHAENEYAQMMFETGALGLACVVAFVALVLRAGWRVVRRPQRTLDFAGFGLMLGFVAILIHSLSDFGQHVPAVAMMTALTAAALLNLAALIKARPAEDPAHQSRSSAVIASYEAAASELRPRWLRLAGVAMLGLLVVGSGVAAVQLEGPRLARERYADGLEVQDRLYGSDETLARPGDAERMIRRFAEAAELDPAVPEYAYRRDLLAWNEVGYDARGLPRDLADDPLAIAEAQAILESVHAARGLAPTYGPHHGLAGEILYFGLSDTDLGGRLIARGAELTPHDPYLAYNVGYVAAREGRMDEALAKLGQAVELDGQLRREVVDVLLDENNDAESAYRFAGEDRVALQYLRDRLTRSGQAEQYAQLLQRLDADIRRILSALASADQPRPGDLAAMARLLRQEGNVADALALYQRAVAIAPKQTHWRIELARLYAEQGDAEQAVREARAVLQLQPNSAPAQQLLNEQVVLRGS